MRLSRQKVLMQKAEENKLKMQEIEAEVEADADADADAEFEARHVKDLVLDEDENAGEENIYPAKSKLVRILEMLTQLLLSSGW